MNLVGAVCRPAGHKRHTDPIILWLRCPSVFRVTIRTFPEYVCSFSHSYIYSEGSSSNEDILQ
jgi:hypothetical protein